MEPGGLARIGASFGDESAPSTPRPRERDNPGCSSDDRNDGSPQPSRDGVFNCEERSLRATLIDGRVHVDIVLIQFTRAWRTVTAQSAGRGCMIPWSHIPAQVDTASRVQARGVFCVGVGAFRVLL
eukprot:5186809-Prymnesium_polylepis.2